MRLQHLSIPAAAVALAIAGLHAQTPEVEDVLDKAAAYVEEYTRTFVGVVAEETYRQEVRGMMRTDVRGFAVEGVGQRRDLKSDMLLVRAPAGGRWIQYRDVFEVDGKAVRDREQRLTKLFLQPSASASQQVDDIVAASARYNIGDVNRNINLPVFALTVLESANRPWFSFHGSRKGGGLWEIDYREERTGTLIRTNGAEPMPVHGHFSIEGATGRVMSSELIAESATLHAEVGVTYAMEPAVGMLVPREMREKYKPDHGHAIEGHATYAKFKRFQVKVDEKITPVKE
jgi:hypothetical protein